MCGRIYCGDKPTVSNIDDREFWKFGRTAFFPDTELNNLFDVSGLGQSRSNRKDLPVPTNQQRLINFRVATWLLFLFIIRWLYFNPNIKITQS